MKYSSASRPFVASITSTPWLRRYSDVIERSSASSSTTNTRFEPASVVVTSRLLGRPGGLGGRALDQGQLDHERRSLAGLALDGDGAAVLLDDAATERQPEPRPLARGLRREEGLEDLLPDLRGNAGPGIGHGQTNTLVLAVELAGEPDAPGRRLRLLAHRVVGIGDEIHQDLMELVGVRPQRRQPGGELAGHLDTVRAQLVGQHLESALDHHVDRHRPALRWPLAGPGPGSSSRSGRTGRPRPGSSRRGWPAIRPWRLRAAGERARSAPPADC